MSTKPKDHIEVTLQIRVPRSQTSRIAEQAKNIVLATNVVATGKNSSKRLTQAAEFWDCFFRDHLPEACKVLCEEAVRMSGVLERMNARLGCSSADYSNVASRIVHALSKEGHDATANAIWEGSATFDGRVIRIDVSNESVAQVNQCPHLPEIIRQLYGPKVTLEIRKKMVLQGRMLRLTVSRVEL